METTDYSEEHRTDVSKNICRRACIATPPEFAAKP
jgi:hypothetical protein